MNESKHIHVIGIGGSAMAPLAGMLREKGFRVTGSDSGVYPPASTLLESLGISFYHTFDAAHLDPKPDLVVVGNIIARGNPELEEVLDRKIPYRSLPEMLEEEFLRSRRMILRVTGQRELLARNRVLARSIRLRNPYVDPMSLIQVELLRRKQQGHDLAKLEYPLGATINGIAAGLHNTG